MTKRFGLILVFFAGLSIEALGETTAQPVFFGFNGGYSLSDNFGDFEGELAMMRDSFFPGNATLFNASGPDAKYIPTDRNGFFDRKANGEIRLKETALRDAGLATIQNLRAAVKLAAAKNPPSATFYFTDHGDQKDFSGWAEDISYQKVQEIDQQFSEDTVVRRIHTHCYSGAALRPIGFNAESSTPDLFLRAYPKNRCAMAAATENEFAFMLAPSWGSDEDPYEDMKLKKPGPSLQDFKSLYDESPSYPASPQLTSDYFLRDLLKRECAQRDPSSMCLASDSIETQLKKMNPVVSAPECSQAQNYEKEIKSFGSRISSMMPAYNALKALKQAAAVDFLKMSVPQEFEAWKNAQKAREALVKCGVLSSKTCDLNRARWTRESVNEMDVRFHERILTLTKEKQIRPDGAGGVKVYGENPAAFKEYLGSAYAAWAKKNTGLETRPSSGDFEEAYATLDNQISKAQDAQREFIRAHRESLNAAAQRVLGHPALAELRQRYDQIRACETTPINQPITQPAKK